MAKKKLTAAQKKERALKYQRTYRKNRAARLKAEEKTGGKVIKLKRKKAKRVAAVAPGQRVAAAEKVTGKVNSFDQAMAEGTETLLRAALERAVVFSPDLRHDPLFAAAGTAVALIDKARKRT